MTTGVDLEAISKGLADTITANTSGLNVYWCPIDNPRYPAAVVTPVAPFISYHETFGDNGLTAINFEIRVFASAVSPESAAIALYGFLGVGTENSVFDAAESDRTWGGTVGDAWVSQVEKEPGRFDNEGTTVLWAAMRAQALERKD